MRPPSVNIGIPSGPWPRLAVPAPAARLPAGRPGGVELVSNFAQIAEAAEATMFSRVLRACHAVRNEWAQVLSGQRSGRRYRVPGTKSRWYTASTPGEAPAQRLGDLRRSLRVMPRFTFGRAQARVGSHLKHALWTEYGTRRMAERPHLRTALKRARPAIAAIFGEGLL